MSAPTLTPLRKARQHWLLIVLLALLLVLQAQIWIGRGSLLDVRRMQTKLSSLKAQNTQTEQTNRQLEAQVQDLKEGQSVIEDKARFELNMIKQGEVFVQLER